MKYIYDRASDSLSIIFADGRRYRDSEEIVGGVVVDYDTAGKPIAIEFHDRASRFVDTDGLASGREVYVENPDAIRSAGREIDGAWLRAVRAMLGFTQEQLAEALSVAKNTIARWERNEVRIEHAGMLKLALERLKQPVPRTDRFVGSQAMRSDEAVTTTRYVTGRLVKQDLSMKHPKTAVKETIRHSGKSTDAAAKQFAKKR